MLFAPIALDQAIAEEMSNPVRRLRTTGGSSCARAINALVRARACPINGVATQ